MRLWLSGQNFDDEDELQRATKALSGAVSLDAYAQLYAGVSDDLAAYLRGKTLTGRMALRRPPLGVRTLAVTSGSIGTFVQEGRPIPVGELQFTGGELLMPRRIATICVVTKELVESARPEAETVLRDDLTKGLIETLDQKFIDPNNAGDDATPASILHGAPNLPLAGGTVADLDAGLVALMDLLIDSGMDLSSAAWVMSSRTKARMALMRSGGALAYPGIAGNELAGFKVFDSAAVQHVGSPGSGLIALVQQSEVNLADAGQSEVEFTRQGDLQMQTAPLATAAQMINMWQNGLVAYRVMRALNWQPRRSGAAAYLSGVSI